MGVLAEYLRTEADSLRVEAHKRGNAVREWLKSVDHLYDLLDVWLKEADGGLGMLGTSRVTEVTLSEGRLGAYTAKSLTIHFLHRDAIYVVPRARNVVARIAPPGQEPRRADGMVEMRSGTSPEYYLFRWATDAGDEWYIQSVGLWEAVRDHGTVQPLDPDRFEAAVLNVLT